MNPLKITPRDAAAFRKIFDGIGRGVFSGCLPENITPDGYGIAFVGGDLSVSSLIDAYCRGCFPWTGSHPIPWFSPDPRLILDPGKLHVSRSLRRLIRKKRFQVRFDTRFQRVMELCAEVPRKGQAGTWITDNMIVAYIRLHELGIAHSVEVYDDGTLCGGLYGLNLGRAFFGESMFSLKSNASKIALHSLCRFLSGEAFVFIDCQQVTSHMMRLGAEPVRRSAYLALLKNALQQPSLHVAWHRAGAG